MNAVALSQSPEPYEVPEGGLASFLTATVGDWSDDALNAENYYDIVKPTAEQLAAFGREEDDRIAHVATGETVIPMAVFEEDPALKEALFARMRDMGIEPERYVVGNELNSINPVTGQPEFFLKKIFKGIKKAVKGVVKVFKKIAPLVLSIGLNFLVPGLGAIASGALGSGIGTLIQGGSIKDAFKAALIGGAVGGISSGIGSVMKGGEFMAGVKSGLPTGLGGGVNPTLPPPAPIETAVPDVVTETATSAGPANIGESAVKQGMMSPGYVGKPGEILMNAGGTGAPVTPAQAVSAGAPAGIMEEVVVTAPRLTSPPAGNYLTGSGAAGAATTVGGEAQTPDVDITTPETPSLDELTAREPESFFEKIRQGRFVDAFKGQRGITKDELIDAILGEEGLTRGTAGYEKLVEAATNANALIEAGIVQQPGMLAKYGPMTALGLGIAGAAGAFEPRPMPEPFDFYGGLTGYDLISQNPENYFLTPFNRDSQGNLLPASGPAYAADGGDISHFPRKNGPIYGPGTETSDDIPAMLSDGEFVMTARAVRGAGNGSRQDGMRRMYDMMRTFEGRAARGN